MSFNQKTLKAQSLLELLGQEKAKGLVIYIKDVLVQGKELIAKAQAKKERDINQY